MHGDPGLLPEAFGTFAVTVAGSGDGVMFAPPLVAVTIVSAAVIDFVADETYCGERLEAVARTADDVPTAAGIVTVSVTAFCCRAGPAVAAGGTADVVFPPHPARDTASDAASMVSRASRVISMNPIRGAL
jgi:hypothetical protein